VDTGRLMGEPTAGLARLDHAIHAALSLAWVGLEAGDRVGFFAFDERPRAWLSPGSGRRAFQSVLHAAGGLEYTTAETNFTLGLTELATRLKRRSLIVVLTEFVDAVAAELMVQNLGRLARRHLIIFVALTDPGLDTLIAAPPSDLDAVHRALIADSLRQDRERVLLRLGRAGVLCVEASPEQVSPALIHRYLRVKSREMI
ncbi:MAG: VWA domain-containing protein, partial [Myxococcota bacterium]